MEFFKFAVPVEGVVDFIVRAHNREQAIEYFNNLDKEDLKYLICDNDVLVFCKNVQQENIDCEEIDRKDISFITRKIPVDLTLE